MNMKAAITLILSGMGMFLFVGCANFSDNGESSQGSFEVKTNFEGRAGSVEYLENGETASFYWEIGGAPIVGFVHVPTTGEWNSVYPWAKGRRDEVLNNTAKELLRQHFPSSTYEITTDTILIREK